MGAGGRCVMPTGPGTTAVWSAGCWASPGRSTSIPASTGRDVGDMCCTWACGASAWLDSLWGQEAGGVVREGLHIWVGV